MGCVKLGAGWGLALAVLFRGGAASHPYDKGEEYKSQQKEIIRIEASWIIVCPYFF